MSRFTASGLDKKEKYSCLYSRAKSEVWLHILIQCTLLAVVISRVLFYLSQHNCDVVNNVNFYVDFVASN